MRPVSSPISPQWPMSDFLAAMAASSRLRAEAARDKWGERALSKAAWSAPSPVLMQLSDRGFDLIAEPKLASPSQGRLISGRDDANKAASLASTLVASGAAAISVLTEPSRFGGRLAHLEEVAATLDVPTMRKDFLVDPIQILEARAAGASGVLLIARITGSPLLVEMTSLARELGMFVLVEIFDEHDLDEASSVFDEDVLIGVNARDLATLDVDESRHLRLLSELPKERHLVAESGIVDGADAASVAQMGYRLALVGTGLVTSSDPSALAAEMISAGRSAVRLKESL